MSAQIAVCQRPRMLVGIPQMKAIEYWIPISCGAVTAVRFFNTGWYLSCLGLSPVGLMMECKPDSVRSRGRFS